MPLAKHQRWFLLACLFEFCLLGVASVLGWLLGQAPLADFHWRLRDALIGGLAAVPMAGAFRWLLRSRWRPLLNIRELLERSLRLIFRPCSLLQLALLSLVAGVSEECLFRGVMQGALAGWISPAGALIVASLLFGLCHLVTRAYGVIAALFGAYLGLLWLSTGNLLAPVVAHALYDFVALAYFLRRHPPDDGARPPPATS